MGFGTRTSKQNIKKLGNFLEKKNIPFVSTWNSADLFGTKFKMNLGTIGMSGQRGANKAVFESDLLVCFGTHMPIPQTTTLYDDYAPNAKKIIINIDQNQLKNLNIKFDLKICSDLKTFFEWLIKQKINKKKWQNTNQIKSMNWYTPVEKNM